MGANVMSVLWDAGMKGRDADRTARQLLAHGMWELSLEEKARTHQGSGLPNASSRSTRPQKSRCRSHTRPWGRAVCPAACSAVYSSSPTSHAQQARLVHGGQVAEPLVVTAREP